MFRNPHMETMSLHYTTSSCDQDMTRCPLQKTYDFFFSKSQFCGGKSNCKILFSCKIVKLSFKKIKIKTYFAQAHRRKYSPSCEWLAMFLFCLIYFLCTWYQQQQGHRNAATVECKRMLLTSKAEEVGGRWRLGGLWVGTLWDWLSISSCRHYQLAKIGNLFKLLFSHMCTLQKIWISFYYLHFHSRATLSTDTQAVWVRNRHPVKGFSRWKWKHWK